MPGDPLHGRAAELEAIAGALDAVARGGRRLVVLRGEAGIGKTRLLAELRERAAAQRFVVLEGRATELERDVPFVPIVDALSARPPDREALAALGPERVELLAELLPGLAPTRRGGAAGERWRMHRAAGELLALVGAGRPLVLVIDDVHWADPATQELLEHLVRRPPAGSLLVALGARPGGAVERVLAAQRAGGSLGLVALDLMPLERAAAEPLLADVAGAGERDRFYAQSGGNPLLLRELARAGGADAVPHGIVAAVRAELDALAPAPRALVEAAAIAGDPFELAFAARIAALDGPTALAALDAVEDRELVRRTADPSRFAFRHPIVRSAVYEGLGSGSRIAGHSAAARALARLGGPLTLRARHLAHAAGGDDPEAAATLAAAAAEVRPRAPGVAADWLLAARRSDPGAVASGLLVATLVEAGRLEEALAAIDAARGHDCAGAATDGQGEHDDAVTGASIERLLGRHDAARRRLEAALDVAEPGSAIRARMLADLAVSAYQRGDYAAMRGLAARVDRARAGGVVSAVVATLLAVGDASAGNAGAAAGALSTALDALGDADPAELGALAEPAMAVSWGLLALDRLAAGLAMSRRTSAAARAAGLGIVAIPHDLAAVLALGLLGRLHEAESAADEAEQAARVSANAQLLQWALWLRAWVLLERGGLEEALAAAVESVQLADRLDDSASAVVARAVLGAVHGALGEHARARDLLGPYDVDNGWICRWAPTLVETHLALGDLDVAALHAERATALAAATGMAGARAAAGRARALVALAHGHAASAAEIASQAASEAAAAGAALEAARATLVAGRALLAADHGAGIAALRAAGDAATSCGAPRVADEARRELRRAGIRVGRGGARAIAGGEGLAALSARELQIAELVADGLTNREIGARLFLSGKTVETHLTRVFQKLGLRSRAQVAARIARGARPLP